MTQEEKMKLNRQRLVDFENKIKEVGVEIGGYAVLRCKDGQFHFIEHPYGEVLLIDKDRFYNHRLDLIDGAELVHKYNP